MKPRTLLLAIAVLAMVIALTSGCLFGGGDEGGAAEGPPEGPEGGPPGPGGEGEMMEPPGGMPGEPGGPPEAGGPPGAPPGEGEELGPSGPPMGEMGAPSAGASISEVLDMKHDGEYADAADELDKILSSDSSNAEAHWILAWILAEQGTTHNNPAKVDEAKEHFQRFIDLSDDQSKISEAEAALDRLG